MTGFLPQMMKMQAELMKALGVSNGAHADSSFTAEQLQAAIGMSCEAAEILDEFNTQTRKWKHKAFDMAMKNAKEEAIDVLLYLLEFFILVGMDAAAIEKAFNRKVLINMARLVKASMTRAQMNEYLLEYRHGHLQAASRVTTDLNLASVFSRLVDTHPSILRNPEGFLDDPVKFVTEAQDNS